MMKEVEWPCRGRRSFLQVVELQRGLQRAGGAAVEQLVVLAAEVAAELLAVPCLVVLEPVEDVLALDLAVEGEVGGDLLDL